MSRSTSIVFLIINTVIASSSWGEPDTRYYTESLKSCQGQIYAPVFDSAFCNQNAYLLQNLSPLADPITIFFEHRLVLLGDTHPNKLLKQWVARNLAQFKAAGFTHVGLEALNSESQSLLNQYKTNPKLKSQVLQLIKDDWGWLPEEHLALIDAIHASGLSLVVLDNRNELERKGLGDKIQLRNEHMADIIQSTLNLPHAGRMIILTGKIHSALFAEEPDELTLPQVLNILNIDSLSLDLESDEPLVPKKMTQAFVFNLLENLLAPSTTGDYYLPAPQGAPVHGIIFISK